MYHKGIHSLIISKDRVSVEKQVKKLCKKAQIKYLAIKEMDNTFQVQLTDSGYFMPGSLSHESLGEDLTAIVGATAKETVLKFSDLSIIEEDEFEDNKEVFDGEKYINSAEGEVEIVQDENTKTLVENKKTIVTKDGEKRVIIGELYVPYDPNDPDTIDTHEHAMTAEEIEKACYEFMRLMNLQKIDKQHDYVEGYGYVVECYIAKEGDPLFTPGAWIIGVKVTCDDTWQQIVDGEITGFSLMGETYLVPAA